MNEYQIQEIIFDKMDSFGIRYTSEHKTFETLAKIDFESICAQEMTLNDKHNNLAWNHVPISVSISSNIVNEPIFLSYSDPHILVASHIGSPEDLALESKFQTKLLFLVIKTIKKLSCAAF